MQHLYDADYYLDGVRTKKSCYENYRWLPETSLPMTKRLVEVLGIQPGETLLDFGCARGYTVRALREIGMEAFGYDISKWAIENCDPSVRSYVSNDFGGTVQDYVFCKDCAEHIAEDELKRIVNLLLLSTRKALLFIVPLAKERDGDYVRYEDNLDATHIIRWTLQDWRDFFLDAALPAFRVWPFYHIEGLKPTSATCAKSCGFLLLQRT